MGLIKNIIQHSQTNIAAEQNLAVIGHMLSNDYLEKVKVETWKDKSLVGVKVPEGFRSDAFHDDVMKAARDLQEFWPQYKLDGQQVNFKKQKRGIFGTKEKSGTVDHQLMNDKFTALKKGAEKWLKDHPTGDEKKTEHCKALNKMAERGIRETERHRLKDASQWLLQQRPEKTGNTRPSPPNPNDQAADPRTIRKFAAEFNVSEQEAKKRLDDCVKSLQTEGKSLHPKGYQNMSGAIVNINMLMPEESRPKLELDEAMALQSYCVVSCYRINKALYGDAFKNVKLATPATPEQIELLEDTMIAALEVELAEKLQAAQVVLNEQKRKTAQLQQECVDRVNEALGPTGERLEAWEIVQLSLEEFQEFLRKLKIPDEAAQPLVQQHRLAVQVAIETDKAAMIKVEEAQSAVDNPRATSDGKNCAAYAQEFAALQKAFAKAKPFPEPVNVKRGLKFKDQAAAEKYVAQLQGYRAKNLTFPLAGFQSSSTASIPDAGRADVSKGELFYVKLAIVAKQGLDAMPYAGFQNERELLLNQGTMVMVAHDITKKVKNGITQWNVDLEQIVRRQ